MRLSPPSWFFDRFVNYAGERRAVNRLRSRICRRNI